MVLSATKFGSINLVINRYYKVINSFRLGQVAGLIDTHPAGNVKNSSECRPCPGSVQKMGVHSILQLSETSLHGALDTT